MNFFVRSVVRHPVVVIVSILAMTAVFSFGLLRVKQTGLNLEDNFLRSDPVLKSLFAIAETFGSVNSAQIVIEAEQGIFNSSTYGKIVSVVEDLKNVDGVRGTEIYSIATVKNVEAEGGLLQVSPFVSDPDRRDAAYWEAVKKKVTSNEMVFKKLVSPDLKATLISAVLQSDASPSRVFDAFEAICKKHSGPEKVYATGLHAVNETVNRGVQRDGTILIPLAFLVVLLIFYFSFGTLRGVLLPGVVVVISLIWTVGLMGYLGAPLSAVTIIVPVLLISIGSAYGIHVIYSLYRNFRSPSEDRREYVGRSVVDVQLPVVLAGVTSAIGTITLLTFRIYEIRLFAVFLTLGIMFALLLAMTLIPAVFVLLPERRRVSTERTSRFGPWMEWVTVGVVAHPKVIVGLFAALFVILSLGIFKLKIGIDLPNYLPKDHVVRQRIIRTNELFGGASFMSVVVNTGKPDGALQPDLLANVAGFQDEIAKDKAVGLTESFVDVVRFFHRLIDPEDAKKRVLPESSDQIAQYMLLYSLGGRPQDFENLINADSSKVKIDLRLQTFNTDEHRDLAARIHRLASRRFEAPLSYDVGGSMMYILRLSEYVVWGKIQNIITLFIIVFLFCLAVFRSLRRSLIHLIPLVFTTFVVFGLMGFLDIHLNLATAMITSISIGVGIDFAIHYLDAARKLTETGVPIESVLRQTANRVSAAIIYNVLANCMGFLVCVASSLAPVRAFGWLITFTMVSTGVSTLILLPAVLTLQAGKAGAKSVKPSLEKAG